MPRCYHLHLSAYDAVGLQAFQQNQHVEGDNVAAGMEGARHLWQLCWHLLQQLPFNPQQALQQSS